MYHRPVPPLAPLWTILLPVECLVRPRKRRQRQYSLPSLSLSAASGRATRHRQRRFYLPSDSEVGPQIVQFSASVAVGPEERCQLFWLMRRREAGGPSGRWLADLQGMLGICLRHTKLRVVPCRWPSNHVGHGWAAYSRSLTVSTTHVGIVRARPPPRCWMRRTRSLSELWVADEREEWHLRSPLSWHETHDHGPDSMPRQSPFGGICSWVELAVPFSQTRVLQSGGKTHKCPKTALVPWELLALETVWLLPLSLLESKFHVNRHVRGMLATACQVDTYSCWEEVPCLWVSGRGIVSLWSDLPCICCPQSNHPCTGSERTACRWAVGARCVGNIGPHS